MKKTIINLSLVITIIFLNSCSGTSDFKHKPTDSVWTAILFTYDWQHSDHRPATARKIIKDTLIFDSVDATTFKQIWKRDSFYLVPISYPAMDTAKKIIKDSFTLQWIWLPKEYLLQDYNKNFKLGK